MGDWSRDGVFHGAAIGRSRGRQESSPGDCDGLSLRREEREHEMVSKVMRKRENNTGPQGRDPEP